MNKFNSGIASLIKTLNLIAFIVLTLPGCSGKSDPSPITTNKKGDIFENEFFGFTVEKPANWHAKGVEGSLTVQYSTSDNESKPGREALITKAMDRTLPLFSFFEFRHGSQMRLNPSVISIAQNRKNFPEAKNACDYLNHVMAVLKKGQIKYVFGNNCRHALVDGKDFASIKAYARMGNDMIYQKYYAAKAGKHFISLILTYFDEESERKVEAVLSTIQFTG